MKKVAVCVTILLMAALANASITANYSWEDGGTDLGTYGNIIST